MARAALKVKAERDLLLKALKHVVRQSDGRGADMGYRLINKIARTAIAECEGLT
jgi:hypothetical protein